ncbi:hypothetical protein LNP02_24040 [Klebsiella variicola subsp. variicola]|nr:hypothetical protein [Klebsiella variicola subsp. variicola]
MARRPKTPSFELNSALLSRARVYLLKSLTTDDIERVLDQTMNDKSRGYGGQDIILPGRDPQGHRRTGERRREAGAEYPGNDG